MSSNIVPTSPRKPLCILHTDSSIGWGGQENRTLKEALVLASRGHRLCFAVPPEARLLEHARDNDFETFPVSMKNGFDFRAIRQLRKLIDRLQPDIINTHSGHDTILAGIAVRLTKHRPLTIRTRHLILPITSRLTYSILPDHVIAVSEATKKSLIEQGVGGERITTITTGLDGVHFDPTRYPKDTLRKELAIDENAPLIGTVAMLRTKKGHDYLMDAVPTVLKNFPDAKFVFIGDNPEYDMASLIEKKGLSDHIALLGLRNVAELLPSLDIMVLPTLEEALGNALLEAQAMRIPVISTKVGGVPEAVDDGNSGLLVPPADSDALARAVIELLNDPARRQAMGEAGRAFVCQHFTMEVMGDRLLACYHRLLDPPR